MTPELYVLIVSLVDLLLDSGRRLGCNLLVARILTCGEKRVFSVINAQPFLIIFP